MPLTEIWSRSAALAACRRVVLAAIPELPAKSVYQGNLDPVMVRPSCRVYPVGEPVERGWTDEQQKSKQQQAWLLTVKTAVVDEPYTIDVLGAQASRVGQIGDTPTSIRNALVASAAGLGKPVSVASVAGASLRIVGDGAGQHLGIAVSSNITRELEADNLHRQGVMPSFWVARFEFEEQPPVDGSDPRAADWATRLRGYLQQGLADEVLRAAHLDFNIVLLRSSFDRPGDRGKSTAVEVLDVQFSAIQGLGHDVPSIESFGTAPAVEVSNAI